MYTSDIPERPQVCYWPLPTSIPAIFWEPKVLVAQRVDKSRLVTHCSWRIKPTFSWDTCPVTGCRNVVVLWLWLWEEQRRREGTVVGNGGRRREGEKTEWNKISISGCRISLWSSRWISSPSSEEPPWCVCLQVCVSSLYVSQWGREQGCMCVYKLLAWTL